jgi:hypothetical protein
MLAKFFLVFSSYTPLFALLAVRLEQPLLRYPLIALGLMGVGALVALLRLDAASSRTPRVVARVEEPGAEAGGYLASYLLPFVIDKNPDALDIVAYAAFLVIAGVVTASTGAVQVNPLIYLILRKVVRVTDTDELTSYVIVRHTPIKGQRIWVTGFQDGVDVMRAGPRAGQDTNASPNGAL